MIRQHVDASKSKGNPVEAHHTSLGIFIASIDCMLMLRCYAYFMALVGLKMYRRR